MRPSLARLLAFVPDIDASLQSFPIFSGANWHPMVIEGRVPLPRSTFFMNEFWLFLVEYNGVMKVNLALLNVVLND